MRNKKLLALLLAIVFVFALSACDDYRGAKNNNTNTNTSSNTNANTNVATNTNVIDNTETNKSENNSTNQNNTVPEKVTVKMNSSLRLLPSFMSRIVCSAEEGKEYDKINEDMKAQIAAVLEGGREDD